MLQLNDTANANFDHAENFDAASGKAFVPTKCFVADSTSNKNFTLFDTGASECSNDIIDLVINYDDDAHVWQFQHTLFLLDNDSSSTYSLTCDVTVCDMSKGTFCKDAYDCLVSSEEATVCVPDPDHKNKYTGNTCEQVVDSFDYLKPEEICSEAYLGGPDVIGKDGTLWRDSCCPQNWDLTKHCEF